MAYNHEHNIAEDSTPAMGAMPVKLVSAAAESDDAGTPDTEYVNRFYLVSKQDGSRTEINKFPFCIGRMSTSDLVIDNKKISRNHAQIMKVNNALIINNDKSLNGIAVNKHKVKRVILRDGDEISIATENYIFEVETVPVDAPVNNDNEQQELQSEPLSMQGTYDEAIDDEVAIQPDLEEQPDKTAASSKKRLLLAGLAATLVMTAGVFGYQYYLQQNAESRVFVVAQKDKDTDNKPDKEQKEQQNDTQVTQDAGNTEQSYTGEIDQAAVVAAVETKPSNVSAKKPSEKTADNNDSSTKGDSKLAAFTQKEVAKPVKPTKTVVTKKTTSKKKWLIERENTLASLDKAMALYHTGDYMQGSQALKDIVGNKRHQPEYRLQADDLNKKISELNGYYESGNKSFAENNKDEAFLYWEKLLKQHQKYFPESKSYYADDIKGKVAAEYEQRGNAAYVNEQWQAAYKNWKNAVAITPREAIQKSINMMDAEIRELYRTGYRYETVNISRAVEFWESVLHKAPSDHEYYIKAAAKLKWYQSRR